MYLSKLSKEFRHRLRQYSYPLVQRRNCGTFAVRIHSSVGFFAQLNQVVRVLAYCNEKGLRARIILTSPLYVARDGDNWFEYFFDPTSTDGDPLPPDASLSFTNVGHIKDLGWPSLADIGIGLDEANRLFGRYATLKADIASHVRSFIDNDLVGKTLGVHFRGTDKISEAPRVRRETIASAIRAHLLEYPETETVFVASDEGPFIDWATDEFRDLRVISHPDAIRSDGEEPVHTRRSLPHNYAKGRDALVNSLILSRCDCVIRSSSFLSAWSSVFNPGLPVKRLNRPFDAKFWFPESAITSRESGANAAPNGA